MILEMFYGVENVAPQTNALMNALQFNNGKEYNIYVKLVGCMRLQ